MADSDRCVLPVCHGGGVKKSFSKGGIDKILSAAKVREDRELSVQLRSLLETRGDTATIVCHHGCYCTYTSKEKIDRLKKAQKRKADGECIKVTRLHTRSVESGAFEYKRDCIFCGKECLQTDGKHPDRWERVRECLTKDRFDKDGNPLPTMKDMILDIAEQRNDAA